MLKVPDNDPMAVALVKAIRTGDLATLGRLLAEHSGLASAMIMDAKGGSRSPLHVVADWPGHFPNGSATVRALLRAGADAKAPVEGCSETLLHWAASCDDVAVLDALLDAGADIEAPGACIAGGTALDDAVAFGQWRAGRRLVERGARTAVWHSSALGLMDRVEAYFADPKTAPLYPWGNGQGASLDEVTIAFWCVCHGGQRQAAENFLDRGAKLNWISDWDGLTSLDVPQHYTGTR
jgi:uncharacterized protein